MLTSDSLKDLPSSSSLSSPLEERKGRSLPSFSDLVLTQKISQSKFSTYLAYSPSLDSYYAMKLFPFKNNSINSFFLNEARFFGLNHSNILSPIHIESERDIASSKSSFKASITLTEFTPYGDFYDILMGSTIFSNETLIRTYFHQLIEGIEYLHSNGIYHLDLKLENLLMGKDFSLKIIDFDLAHMTGDGPITIGGTENYRAPEIRNKKCEIPAAADVYSAAIILFILKSGGLTPYQEKQSGELNLFDLLHQNPKKFWQRHCVLQCKTMDFWGKDFIELFTGMTSSDANNRMTIEDVKKSKWYQGKTYSQEELLGLMGTYYESS